MRTLVAGGLAQGAVGMSSGLTYTPGMYASGTELAELCRVVASYGGYYCPHHRSYGRGALAAYAEMVALAREAGCALHLAHATMNFAENEGRASELLSSSTGPSPTGPTSASTRTRTPRLHHPRGAAARLGERGRAAGRARTAARRRRG